MLKEQGKIGVSADQIRKMDETQWNEYRKASWLRKRAYYDAEMPDYYLSNKEKYANYIEKLASRKGSK